MSRLPIATRYAALVAALLSVALIVSGALETWVSHRDGRAALESLQREKAQAAATAVSRFVEDVLRNLDWATLATPPIAAGELAERRLDFVKLLRLEPAITTATLVDPRGREQLRVSRIVTDRIASGIDQSSQAGFAAARTGRVDFGTVHFVAQTEPYLTIAAPSAARDGSVVIADVNLKFVNDVVSKIKVGATGYAYVVDARGRLVSHPEMSLVLQMTDLSGLPQVQAANASEDVQGFADDGRDPSGVRVLSAHAKIPPLNWTVFVEQPRAEAIAPLIASIARNAVILIVALALAVTAGVVAARRMVGPIDALRRGAQRFGAGDLSHRIDVASGDELQELAEQFNAMGAQLRQTYADLERRVAERTRDLNLANQAKSRFLAAASHDLRQPMHALALFVGQLSASRTRAERAALTQRIEEAVASLTELLDQLLDLSKLEAGALQAVHEEFPLGDLLEAIERQFAPLAHAKGVALRLRSSPAWLRSDPVLVQRILLNLVSNAIRYTEHGGVLVGCRKRGERMRIAVWDTGCGIPEDRRKDVFHEFVQLGDPGDRRADGLGRGLGLGLAIVAGLAPLLGTCVELRSRVGRGSMFAFELPLGVATRARAQPAVVPLHVAGLRGTFALVIDDDEAARGGTCGLLESWGCVTLAAADGDDAIRQLSAHDRPPELIVCDYRLSTDENGLEAMARVRAAVGGDVPTIIITGDASNAVLNAAQLARVPLLRKPVSPVKLRALLTHLLSAAGGVPRVSRSNSIGSRV